MRKSDFDGAAVDGAHPLIGTWVESKDPIYTTPVVYRISARAGQFCVAGLDESDGVSLRVSDVSWDGKKLRFTTVFPPTSHKATHEFWMTGKGLARHQTRYSDEDGAHNVLEFWKKRT